MNGRQTWGLLLLLAGLLYTPPALHGEREVLRIGIRGYPRNIHPVYVTGETSQMIVNKIYQSLFQYDSKGKIRPELLKSWQWSGATRVLLVLREGMRFSNGHTLTAEDCTATIRLLQDPRTGYPYRANLDFIEKMVPAGPRRMELHLKHPYAQWKHHLTFKILDAAEVRDTDPEECSSRSFSGSHAYRLHRESPPDSLILKNNPYHPDEPFHPSLKLTVCRNPLSGAYKLLSGELDVAPLSGGPRRIFFRHPGWKKRFRIHRYTKVGYHMLIFNCRGKEVPLPVRQKFHHLIITRDLAKQFMGNRGITFSSPFYPLNPAPPSGTETPHPKIPGEITIMTNSENRLRKQFLLFLAQSLKESGLKLQCRFYEYHTFRERLKKGNFQVALTGFLLEPDYNLKDLLHSESHFNYGGFSHPEMDRLLEKGLEIMDPEERREVYLQAHRLWQEELPVIPLFQPFYYLGTSLEIQPGDHFFATVSSENDALYHIHRWQ